MQAMHYLNCFIILTFGRASSSSDLPFCSVSVLDEAPGRPPRTRSHSLLQRGFAVDAHLKQAEGEKSRSHALTDTAGRARQPPVPVVSDNNATRSAQIVAKSEEHNLQDEVSVGTGPGRVRAKASLLLCTLLGSFIILNLLLVWYFSTKEKLGPDKVQHELFNRNANGKVYVYSNEQLLTWWVLLTKTPAIVMSWRVWVVGPCVLALAYGVALMVVFQSHYANMIDTKRIDEFGKYLRVFIAFMLGLFMNNSFQRWHTSVSLFRQVLTSVKQLMFTARLMKVRTEVVEELQRKCLIACYILEAEMRIDLNCKASGCKEHWDNTWKSLEEKGILTQAEEKAISRLRNGQGDMDMGGHSTMIWAWIGQVVQKVRDEPGLLVPMYIRMVTISHGCLGQVDKLKTVVHVQVPFTYAYLLSTIVHLNNIILALCSGLAIGASLTGLDAEENGAGSATQHVFYKSGAVVAMQTMILLIQPLMYQACLVIAHLLNHPFGDQIFHLPTETFIELLQDELQISADCFENQNQALAVACTEAEKEVEDNDDDDDDGDDGDDCDDDGGDGGGDGGGGDDGGGDGGK